MKVTVTKYLNVRIGKPSVNATCFNYLAPGSIIEVEEVPVEGDTFDENKLWYKGLDGSYYWSGGVETPKNSSGNPSPSMGVINYNAMFQNIPGIIRNTKGKEVVVAVLDTGIYQNHPDFINAFDLKKYPSSNFTNSPEYSDVKGHGSHVAGLIGGRCNDDKGVIGVAPECILQNIKVLLDDGSAIGSCIEKGLKIISPETDIINLSLSVTFDEYEVMAAAIDNIAKTSIIIAAAGDNSILLANPDNLFCPALSPNVIAIGTINSDFIKNHPSPQFNPRLDYILPEMDYISCSTKENNFYRSLRGSSMASGLLSGLVALIISANKSKVTIDRAFITTQLDTIATKFDSDINLNTLTLIKP